MSLPYLIQDRDSLPQGHPQLLCGSSLEPQLLHQVHCMMDRVQRLVQAAGYVRAALEETVELIRQCVWVIIANNICTLAMSIIAMKF
jgi:hypothetical protein